MITALTTIGLVTSFLLSGYIIQALKQVIKLIITISLRLISFFGIKIKKKEKSVKVSKEFRQTYKEIKHIRMSNKNLKTRSSIDWLSLGAIIACLILIVANFNAVSGNMISNALYNLVENWKIIGSAKDMNTLFTAGVFSVLSFAISRFFQRWKDTKAQRIEKKNNKIKAKAMKLMTTKELLMEAKNKDKTNRKNLE